MSKLFKILLLLSLIPFFFGFLQAYHPLFDSFSHFRYHILVAIVLLLALIAIFDKKRVMFAALFLISLSYLYVFPMTYGQTPIYKSMPSIEFTQMQFNLNFRNRDLDSVINLLSSRKPDIVTMQEVTNAHREKLEQLNSLYPYKAYCDFYPIVGGVAILSRYPMDDVICARKRGLVSANIDINATKINVVSLHLYWPYPYSQYTQVDELKPILHSLKDAKYRLISGDFNASPWSNIVKIIAKESDTDLFSGLLWTIGVDGQLFSVPFSVKLPIDHLLLHGMYPQRREVLGYLGSDHYPIFSTIKIWKF